MGGIEDVGASKDKALERKVILEKPRSSEVLGRFDTCYLYVSPIQAIQDEFYRLMNAGSAGFVQVTLRVDPQGRMQSSGHFGEVYTHYKSGFGEAALSIQYRRDGQQQHLLHAQDASGNEVPVQALIDRLEKSGDPSDPDQQNGATVLRSMEQIVKLGSA